MADVAEEYVRSRLCCGLETCCSSLIKMIVVVPSLRLARAVERIEAEAG